MASSWNFDQTGNPPGSPFTRVPRTADWKLAQQSPAVLKEQMNVYNTPSRYAASLAKTPLGYPNHKGSASTPFRPNPSVTSTPGSRMDIDYPEDNDVLMVTPDQPQLRQPTQDNPFFSRSEARMDSHRQHTPPESPIVCRDGGDPGMLSPTRKRNWFRRVIPGFDTRKRQDPEPITQQRRPPPPPPHRPRGRQSSAPAPLHNTPAFQSRTLAPQRELPAVPPRARPPQRQASAPAEDLVSSTEVSTRETTLARRRQIREREQSESESNSDADDSHGRAAVRFVSPPRTPSPAQSPPPVPEKWFSLSMIPSFFSYLHRHPNLPQVLFNYFALSLFIVVAIGALLFVYSVWSAFADAVNKAANEDSADLMAEIAVCAKHYRDNLCAPATRVPAMEVICNNWNKCMSRSPEAVKRLHIFARVCGEVYNSFVEAISPKALLVMFTIFLIAWPPGVIKQFFSRSAPETRGGYPDYPSALPAYPPTPGLMPPSTPHHFHHDPNMMAHNYGPVPIAFHYVPQPSPRRLMSPTRAVAATGYDEDDGEEEIDGSPAPLKAIEYNPRARSRRLGSVEAVVGSDTKGPQSRRGSTK